MKCIRCQHPLSNHAGRTGPCLRSVTLEYRPHYCHCKRFMEVIPVTKMPKIIAWKDKQVHIELQRNGRWKRLTS